MMNLDELNEIVCYLRREMTGKILTGDGTRYTVEKINLQGSLVVFEGQDLTRASSFKATYRIDEQGDLHSVELNKEGVS